MCFCDFCNRADLMWNLKSLIALMSAFCCIMSGLIPRASIRCSRWIWSGVFVCHSVNAGFSSDLLRMNELVNMFLCFQEVLRWEDRHIFRLVGFLHNHVDSGRCGRTRLFHIWIQDQREQHVEVHQTFIFQVKKKIFFFCKKNYNY